MNKKIFKIFSILLILLFLFSIISCRTTDIKTIEKTIPSIGTKITIKESDKILILAPHPDDETIGTAGVIQEALKAGAKINVVYLTNGDFQSFNIIYEENPPIVSDKSLFLGETRRKESIEAINKLGLEKDDIKFLGYPDCGTLDILFEYWGNIEPYINPVTKASKVPYPDCYSTGAEYVGENILKDLKNIIKEFQPTKVFLSSPIDLKNDHRALYLFLKVALWDLKGKIKDPEIFTYLVHAKSWPYPCSNGYHPDKSLEPADKVARNNITWSNLNLDSDEIKKKFECMLCYKSQFIQDQLFLISFVRENELFEDFHDIELENINQNKDQIVWQIASNNDLFYAINNNSLLIKMALKQKIDKDFIISIYLLGYSNETEFSKMPKINIKIDMDKLEIFNKGQEINNGEVRFYYEGGSLFINVPLIILENPEYILSGIETAKTKYLSNNIFGWRVLNINS